MLTALLYYYANFSNRSFLDLCPLSTYVVARALCTHLGAQKCNYKSYLHALCIAYLCYCTMKNFLKKSVVILVVLLTFTVPLS